MPGRMLSRVLLILLCLAVGLALAEKFCPSCGTSNPDNARFCRNCGYEFPQPRPQPAPTPPGLPTLRVSVNVGPEAVTISSTPEGAAVVVAGVSYGTTPVRLTGLAPGRYNYELSRDGYRRYSGSFTVARPTGSIRVTTFPPGAQVLIDGRDLGAVPDTGLWVTGLEPGTRMVLARLAGRADETRSVVLDATRPVAAVSIVFPPVDGLLRVESNPTGAFLSLDGQRVGRTRYSAALKPAEYGIELTLDGFRSWREDVTVRLGDTTSVFATLVPVRARRWGLLALGLAGVAGGTVGAVLGQSAYNEYLEARPPEYTPDGIARLRARTETLDWVRNIAGGVGVLSLGAFLAF